MIILDSGGSHELSRRPLLLFGAMIVRSLFFSVSIIPRKERGMSKVVAIMSMSLDGYVADRNDGVAEVFDWYLNSGDVEIHTGGADPMTLKMSAPSAEHFRGLTSGLGAVLTGRRTFEVAHGWGGNHAWGPAFVLTHHVPAGWPRPNSTVHFVTDGIESAV